MTETITLRLRAHIEAASAVLAEMVLVAVTQPAMTLAGLRLLDVPIQIAPLGDEWRMLFARAGARLDALTTTYRSLAREMQRTSGVESALASYILAETARRRLLPFPEVGRPRVTPQVTPFLVATHNLFWLVRNRRSIETKKGEETLNAAAADLVLSELQLVADSEALEVGDLMVITELFRWAVDLLSETRGQAATIPFSLVGVDDGREAAVPAWPGRGVLSSGAYSSPDAWLSAAVAAFRPEFAARGYKLPEVIVFARKPARRRSLAFRRPSGTARWSSGKASAVEIEVDPRLRHPVDVLAVLKHELLHAALFASDPHHGHGAQFQQTAAALGMQPRRSTPWTAAGRTDAAAIAESLGPYPSPAAAAASASGRRFFAWLFRRSARPMADAEPPDNLLPLPEALTPSLLALRTLSPIARIEGAADGLQAFAGWDKMWPGFRRLVAAQEAVTVRQELVSRLGLRLAAPGLADDRLAAVLKMLAALDGLPRLSREHWLNFVADLLTAILGVAAEDADPDSLRWRRWTQEPDGQRSLAYWTGRLSRVAEDLATPAGVHERPRLVWCWRDIARSALVPWLDAGAYRSLCLGHWLEGLLEGSDAAPRLTVGRRVCGFGLADIFDLWQRSGEAEPALQVDESIVADLRAGLARCRERLGALPVTHALAREARNLSVGSKAEASAAIERPKLADLVRYARFGPTVSGPTAGAMQSVDAVARGAEKKAAGSGSVGQAAWPYGPFVSPESSAAAKPR